VAGFAGPADNQEFAIARYNPDGSLDSGFGQGGTVLTDFGGNAGATSIVVTPSGQLIVAGSVEPSASSSASDFALARYNADGSLDTTFGTGGKVTTHWGDFSAGINQILLQPDGKILAAGHTSTSSGFFNFALARYNPDGSLDTSFGGTGMVTTHFGSLDDARGLVLQPDGKIVAVGAYSTGAKVDLALARYLPDGSLDATFGTGGQVTTDLGGLNQSASSVILQPDGKLVAAGVYEPQGVSEFLLARYQTDGTLDTSFGTNGFVLTPIGSGVNSGAVGLVRLADGTWIAGGNSGSHFALVHYLGDTAPADLSLTTPDAIFVNRVYQTLLARPVDDSGLATWTGSLAQGATRAQIVQAIESSPEYLTRVIDGLYQALLGRNADPTGQTTFVNALESGATVEQVEGAILGSGEYSQRAGVTDAAFLQAVYQAVLGRAVDPTGASAWTAALAGGMSRTQVAELILTSGEAEQDLVQGYYERFLSRSADVVGLAAWLGQLQEGQRDEQIAAGFLGSGEFFGRL
jgi:uncharacterized delta-60 repeat protein